MKCIFIEIIAGDCVVIIAGDFVELIEAVIHAAVLNRENGIMRLLVPCLAACERPVTELGGDFLRSLLAGEVIDIDESLNHLVHGVPRHPSLIDDVGLVLLDQIELLLDVVGVLDLTCPEESGPALGIVLALLHAVEQCIQFVGKRLALRIRQIRILIRHCNRGEIVTDRMTCDQ